MRGGAPLRELIPLVAEGTGLPVIGCGGLADRDDVARVLALGARAAMLGTRFAASSKAQATPAYKARLVRATADDLYLEARHDAAWPSSPRRGVRTDSSRETSLLFAGMGIDRIRDILPAAEIVRRLDPGPRR